MTALNKILLIFFGVYKKKEKKKRENSLLAKLTQVPLTEQIWNHTSLLIIVHH